VGRFAAIVNVVMFVTELGPAHGSALQEALQTVGVVPDRSPDLMSVCGLGEWFAGLNDDAAFFWRRCLVQTIQLLPPREKGGRHNTVAAAREVARHIAATRSFTPRQY